MLEIEDHEAMKKAYREFLLFRSFAGTPDRLQLFACGYLSGITAGMEKAVKLLSERSSEGRQRFPSRTDSRSS